MDTKLIPPVPPPDYDTIIKDNININQQTKLKELINKYNIDPFFSEKLELLNNYEIVLLCDDSGSMNTSIKDNKNINLTRWDELKSIVNIVISIANVYDNNGIDIHFLNRGIYNNIKFEEQASICLEDMPCGGTPLTSTLSVILEQYKDSKKPLLLVIATDGVPTINGKLDLDNFKYVLQNKSDNVYISFLACSDNNTDVDYLNELDKTISNIDTLDDYKSELKEVQNVQGKNFKYSLSDHIVRLLLGPICPEMDKLDEEKINTNTNNLKNKKKKKFTKDCKIL